jgi:hypothetical protein
MAAAFEVCVDGARELSFEVAECFASYLAFVFFAFEVGACGWVPAALRDGDAVKGAVELSVAAAVEAVACRLPELCVERRDTSMACKLRVRAESVDRADLAEQLGRA